MLKIMICFPKNRTNAVLFWLSLFCFGLV